MNRPHPIIELQNVSAMRGNQLALKNVTLSLPLGEHHAILGPNGAGKSTLIKLISRELYPFVNTESWLKIFGEEHVNIWQLREKIGFVSHDFQNDYRSLATGIEVVVSAFFGSVGVHKHQQPEDWMRQKALDTLKALNSADLAEKHYLRLSTGQQRRLLLARALVHKPQALILDEPTNGLDLQAKFWFIKQMRTLCQTGTTLIIVSHDPSEILPEIDKVTMIKFGKVFKTGARDEIVTEMNLQALYDCELKLHKQNRFFQVSPPDE